MSSPVLESSFKTLMRTLMEGYSVLSSGKMKMGKAYFRPWLMMVSPWGPSRRPMIWDVADMLGLKARRLLVRRRVLRLDLGLWMHAVTRKRTDRHMLRLDLGIRM